MTFNDDGSEFDPNKPDSDESIASIAASNAAALDHIKKRDSFLDAIRLREIKALEKQADALARIALALERQAGL